MGSRILIPIITLSNWKPCGFQLIKHLNLYYNPHFTIRNTSFFNKLPADDIWKGVTAVSNAGKKRGRGKGTGRKIAKDLNKGQTIGLGKMSCIWPGLNAPILRGNELVQQRKQSENVDRENNLMSLRDASSNFKLTKLSSIDRGWSGTKMAGRSIGSPDAVGEDTLNSFDTRVLENKIVFIMKGNMGRKRRYSVLSVTGNANGLAGFATAKAPEARTALRKSKNRAIQKVISINLYESRTINHDFYTGFGRTKLFVFKKPEGHGLICHRSIQTICKVIGIKDLYAKIEGSTNLQHIVKAFFIGLMRQKTYQDIANESNLHIVEREMSKNCFTQVKASPLFNLKTDESDGNIDLTQFTLENKIVLKKKNVPPFYVQTKGHNIYEYKKEQFRNQATVRLQKMVNLYL